MIKNCILVFLGGGFGSLLRFVIYRWCLPLGWIFPLATFLSNLLSCFVLGLVLALRSRGSLSADFQYLLAVGFCGGFSTFSTFSMENFTLIQEGRWLHAACNIIASVSFGFAAVFLGFRLIA